MLNGSLLILRMGVLLFRTSSQTVRSGTTHTDQTDPIHYISFGDSLLQISSVKRVCFMKFWVWFILNINHRKKKKSRGK